MSSWNILLDHPPLSQHWRHHTVIFPQTSGWQAPLDYVILGWSQRGCHSLEILRYLTILNLLLVTSYSPPQRYVTLHMITRCHGQRCCVAADWQLERGEVTASHHRVRVMLADSCHTFTATTKYPLIILFILYAMELVPHLLLPVLFSSLGQTNFTHRPNIPKYAAPVTPWSRRWWTAAEISIIIAHWHCCSEIYKYRNNYLKYINNCGQNMTRQIIFSSQFAMKSLVFISLWNTTFF